MASHPEFNKSTEASTVAATFSKEIKGRTFLITGVSPNGLGESTCTALAAHEPGLLILTGRSQAKVQAVIDKLAVAYPATKCRYLQLDLSNMTSVRKAAQEVLAYPDVPEIDVVICNAGVMWITEHEQSADNIEMQFATNHIGHFLFVNLVLEKLKAVAAHSPAGAVRVVNLASLGAMFSPVRFSDPNFGIEQNELPESEQADHKTMEMYGMASGGRYNPFVAYGQSKTANILFSLGLTNRLFAKYGIKSYALHPGGIKTELWRHTSDAFTQQIEAVGGFKTLEQGASTTLVAALDPALPTASITGDNLFLDDCQIIPAVEWARNQENSEKLWALSEELVGEHFSV